MEHVRKPFQGIFNIVRFNWHYYFIAICLLSVMLYTSSFFEQTYQNFIYFLCALAFFLILVSLLVSHYIYDISGLYKLNWVVQNNTVKKILNINAGFDETSHLLQSKFHKAELLALDFYNPEKHTEVSIKRARKSYPPYPKTKQIETSRTGLSENSADIIFVILAAHEIRDTMERIEFFKELRRVINPTGQIYVTEHLRDLPNFMAYTLGFFHFHSKSSWLKTFKDANLKIRNEIKLTPFISNFILEKNGDTL
ncbi:MAG: methyltransferase domain-containing protein [Bacteroidia bacterium]|jgi:SAM-dependent methyltransferase|nr:methyltransferase domain-containing protein [Bacteroidia bacterium]MBP7244316.1 methyltransferase domain-containing protein [Bacteroidia bacterium]